MPRFFLPGANVGQQPAIDAQLLQRKSNAVVTPHTRSLSRENEHTHACARALASTQTRTRKHTPSTASVKYPRPSPPSQVLLKNAEEETEKTNPDFNKYLKPKTVAQFALPAMPNSSARFVHAAAAASPEAAAVVQ